MAGTFLISCSTECFHSHYSIRLYGTRTLKPLGTLKYHKAGCQAVEFARSCATDEDEDEDEDEEMSREDEMNRARWLVGAGKDHRVSIWALMNFDKL